MLPGITADGYILTRKYRLAERYFNYSFNGFDYYYHLFVDRSDSFVVDYIDYKSKDRTKENLAGISIKERQKVLYNRYNIDEQKWFKKPSPAFEINRPKNFAILTISRSFSDNKVDPNFDSLIAKAFGTLKSN